MKKGKKKQHVPATCRHTLRVALYSCCLCLLFAACRSDEEGISHARTILFYMAGDNNLAGEVDGKVDRLLATPVPAGCRLLVFRDTREANPQLLEIVGGNKGQNTQSIIRDYEECNTADAAVLGKILQEVASLYPSESYGLVFFSHASGWMPEQTYSKPGLRSIGMDKGREMELPAFAGALPDGMFDFIIFETCHMAGIEVAWELKEKTDYIVASSAEIVSPGFSPVYPKALPCLFEQEPKLKKFVELVAEDYRTRQDDYSSLTLSLINTRELEGLATALQDCAWPLPVGNSVQPFDRYGKRLFFDFYDAFSQSMVAGQAIALQAAISKAVICKAASAQFMPAYGGFDISSHSGLTSYLPQEQYPKLNGAYKKLRWYEDVIATLKITVSDWVEDPIMQPVAQDNFYK